MKEKDNWRYLKQFYNIDESIDVLMEKRDRVFQNFLRDHIVAMPGVLGLIKELKKNNIKIAIASSSVPDHIDFVVKGLNIKDNFDVILSAFKVKRGKPFPDVYLEAANKLKVAPSECVVLEDAQSGVESGHNAGMRVIAVPNKFTKEHDFSKADLVIDSLEDKQIYKYLNI